MFIGKENIRSSVVNFLGEELTLDEEDIDEFLKSHKTLEPDLYSAYNSEEGADVVVVVEPVGEISIKDILMAIPKSTVSYLYEIRYVPTNVEGDPDQWKERYALGKDGLREATREVLRSMDATDADIRGFLEAHGGKEGEFEFEGEDEYYTIHVKKIHHIAKSEIFVLRDAICEMK